MQQIPFPHYATDSAQLIFWKVEEIIPFALFAVIGMATDMLLYCAGVGLVLSYLSGKYSAGRPDGFVMHALYWWGLPMFNARCAINPYQRMIFPR